MLLRRRPAPALLLPDLVVSSISYSSSTRKFSSFVKNQGTAATPTGVYLKVNYFVDGVYKTSGQILGPLVAGASIKISQSGRSRISRGTHKITATVNADHQILELNTGNNEISTNFIFP